MSACIPASTEDQSSCRSHRQRALMTRGSQGALWHLTPERETTFQLEKLHHNQLFLCSDAEKSQRPPPEICRKRWWACFLLINRNNVIWMDLFQLTKGFPVELFSMLSLLRWLEKLFSCLIIIALEGGGGKSLEINNLQDSKDANLVLLWPQLFSPTFQKQAFLLFKLLYSYSHTDRNVNDSKPNSFCSLWIMDIYMFLTVLPSCSPKPGLDICTVTTYVLNHSLHWLGWCHRPAKEKSKVKASAGYTSDLFLILVCPCGRQQ